jgi:NTE family protein
MQASDFTQHPIVKNLIGSLKKTGVHRKIFSDVLDDEGHQYVDLVQEGGGVLGIALLGYVYVLEKMGIRFLGLAGTSAGAINALLLAAIPEAGEKERHQSKAELVLERIAQKDFFDFVDGDAAAREFAKVLIESHDNNVPLASLVWKSVRVLNRLWQDWGLVEGAHFYQWLKEGLAEHQIYTAQDLENRLAQIPEGLRIRQGIRDNTDGLRRRLAIVATDVTTETKVIFPEMKALYWHDNLFSPADFVRASMSIPFFFLPFKIENLPQGRNAQLRWKKLVNYRGAIPKTAYFVDGGMVSNFPIDVFHTQRIVPRLPTFGAKLGKERLQPNTITNPFVFSRAILDAARQVSDYNFLLRNRDYNRLITWIDTGKHKWIDFRLSEEDKLDLFIRGAKAGAYFLRTFDWEEYKRIRTEGEGYLPPAVRDYGG